ncbi:MAG: hypothetical protein HY885_07610 [Deltaproteobacteria bacterium]|nr:hypothetical protein [Deltaproteobacteria bacterium]
MGLNVEWKRTEIFTLLEKLKQACIDDDFKPRPIQLRGFENFIMHPTGKKGGYGWHISTSDIHIFLSRHDPRGSTPNVFVEIGSISCWTRGVHDVFAFIELCLNLQGGFTFKKKINRVDLAVDFVGLDIQKTGIFNKDHWVMLPRKWNIHGEVRRENTAAFGFTSNSIISLRIYDKLLELQRDPAKMVIFKRIWGVPLTQEIPVTRVEFQIRKDALKEFKAQKYDDFNNKIQGIWDYLCKEWFRLAHVTSRSNTQKAKNTEWWDIVTDTKWSDITAYVERQSLKPSKAVEPLIDQAAGIAISVCAYLQKSADNIEEIITTFNQLIRQKLIHNYSTKYEEFIQKFVVRQADCWDHLYASTIPGL